MARRAVPSVQKRQKIFIAALIQHMRVPLLALLVLFLVSSLIAAVEKPFNFDETPGKLPKEVVPTEYAVRIVPNLDNFTFAGSETVKLNVRSPLRELVLNALE